MSPFSLKLLEIQKRHYLNRLLTLNKQHRLLLWRWARRCSDYFRKCWNLTTKLGW